MVSYDLWAVIMQTSYSMFDLSKDMNLRHVCLWSIFWLCLGRCYCTVWAWLTCCSLLFADMLWKRENRCEFTFFYRTFLKAPFSFSDLVQWCMCDRRCPPDKPKWHFSCWAAYMQLPAVCDTQSDTLLIPVNITAGFKVLPTFTFN